MNTSVIRNRISRVLMVDSINNLESDFLATHIPFRSINIRTGIAGNEKSTTISEDKLYSKFISDPAVYDKHQLIIVEGSSGSGKSHFIRWLHAKLTSEETRNDVILLIRRSDNTLKGTIKQLLDIDEVKNLKNKDAYEHLVKATQTISEQKFKTEIYYKFIAELKSDESEGPLNKVKRGNLHSLLTNELFEERMMAVGGPIERIYQKIVSTDLGANQDTVALFEAEDFILDTDFGDRLRISADKKAVKMANALIPDDDGDSLAGTVAAYMNTLVESVIQSCAGIEPGDFQQIFKEIRQELYKQGKNLVLLIEDITSFTGINQALLNALITEHTGLNAEDNLCRLLSVVGTTSEYYKQFRDNYKDRITSQITIEDGAIGNNPNDLLLFVAKYLNVASLDSDVVETWYKNGALESEYPVHNPDESLQWDYIKYEKKQLSLYPFTSAAILNLYNMMENHKTPRYILREIVEPAINDVLTDKKHFPAFLIGKHTNLQDNVILRIQSIISNAEISQDEKTDLRDRIIPFVGFWGNGSLDSFNGDGSDIGNINRNYFEEFGLEVFEKLIQKGKTVTNPTTKPSVSEQPEPAPVEPVRIIDKDYENFISALASWHYDKKSFVRASVYRDELCNFIYTTIDWQREGIPNVSREQVKSSSKTIIAFERQDRNIENGLIILPENDETYELILSIGKYKHLGKNSWSFPGASDCIYTVTKWISKHKNELVKAVRESVASTPEYVQCAMILEVYRKILIGEFNYSQAKGIRSAFFLQKYQQVNQTAAGHSDLWNGLFQFLSSGQGDVKTAHEFYLNYFKTMQGTDVVGSKYIINYGALKKAVHDISALQYEIPVQEIKLSAIKSRSVIQEKYKGAYSRLADVAKAEIQKAKEISKEIKAYWEYDESMSLEATDIRVFMDEIIDFYNDVQNYGYSNENRIADARRLKSGSDAIAKALATMSADYSTATPIEILIAFSDNPIGVVLPLKKLLDFLDIETTNLKRKLEFEKDSLARSGNWQTNEDPRFKKYEDTYFELVKSMEA